MGVEHIAAVIDHSRRGGSHLVLLMIIANYSDHNGTWRIDQPTLQRKSRLSRRRVQEILEELVASGEIAVVSDPGRGRFSTYRLQVGEKAQEAAEAPTKGAAERALPAPPCPPFPPHPQFPLYPPRTQETFGLRPLPGPQSAVFRVNLLLEEAAVPLPTPAQIGLWSKTLGGIEPLLELLRRLVPAGLANKRAPLAYIHRAVIERAAHPEPVRVLKSRNPVLMAGADEVRRQQALRIIAKTRGEK